MKIVCFNVKDKEKETLEKWRKAHPEITIDYYTDALTLDTIDRVEGTDCVSLSAPVPVEAELLEALHARGVDVISQRSVGYDKYDLDTMNKLNMRLLNLPKYSPYAIAEYVVASALYFTRNLHRISQNVEHHDFRWNKPILAKEMRTLTVGIVGTGNIGRTTAELFKGLGARVIGYNRHEHDEVKKVLDYVSLDELYAQLDELYAQSDIITFHIPATDETYHMVDDEAIAKMKDGVVLINAARGSIIDTEALRKGLNTHKIKAAALDVYENESNFVNHNYQDKPLNDPTLEELIQRNDVLYTPHLAFYTETALDQLMQTSLDDAKKFLETGEAETIVNE